MDVTHKITVLNKDTGEVREAWVKMPPGTPGCEGMQAAVSDSVWNGFFNPTWDPVSVSSSASKSHEWITGQLEQRYFRGEAMPLIAAHDYSAGDFITAAPCRSTRHGYLISDGRLKALGHSDEPNARYTFSGHGLYLHALRGIKAGEEVTVNTATNEEREDFPRALEMLSAFHDLQRQEAAKTPRPAPQPSKLSRGDKRKLMKKLKKGKR